MNNYKSLETWCAENNKEWLLEQWDEERNYPMLRSDVPFGSTKKYYWKYTIFYERINDYFTFSWLASPNQRTTAAMRNDNKCPFISGPYLYKGYNDLQTVNPEVAKLWHPTKNGSKTPTDVMAGSDTKAWWLCPYDDPVTKKHFDFEWESSIKYMNRNNGNPFLTNHKVYKGYNDLATWCRINKRTDILKEYSKGGNDLSPSEICYGSKKYAMWKCGTCGGEWRTRIVERTKDNTDCPFCARQFRSSFQEMALFFYVQQYFPDALNGFRPEWLNGMELDVFIPSLNYAIEYDGVTYHGNSKSAIRDKNKNILCNENNVQLVRVREKGCPRLAPCDDYSEYYVNAGNNADLHDAIIDILKNLGIENPQINIDKDRQLIKSGYLRKNQRKSLQNSFPSVAYEWHPTKNGVLNPKMFSPYSDYRAWWKCPNCGNEYEATISNRTGNGSSCPKCARKLVGKKQTKYVMCINTGEFIGSTEEAAQKYGCTKDTISCHCREAKPMANGDKLVYVYSVKEFRQRLGATLTSYMFRRHE